MAENPVIITIKTMTILMMILPVLQFLSWRNGIAHDYDEAVYGRL